MPWVEDDEYELLQAVLQEAQRIVAEPFQPWSEQQAAAYEKLCQMLNEISDE